MWYAASLLFKGEHTPPIEASKWEESIRLIQATSENDARSQAESIGRAEQHGYSTENGSIFWRFERIERIYVIGEETFRSGTEVFSRFLRQSEVDSLLTPFDSAVTG